jgi:hypothetical protein
MKISRRYVVWWVCRDRGKHTHELLRLKRQPPPRPKSCCRSHGGAIWHCFSGGDQFLSSYLGYVLVDAVQSLCWVSVSFHEGGTWNIVLRA